MHGGMGNFKNCKISTIKMFGKQSFIVGEASVQIRNGSINIVILNSWIVDLTARMFLINLRAKGLAS